jgi:DNA-binding LacI/PurR family transcriptional regulator
MQKLAKKCLWEKVTSDLVAHIEDNDFKPGSTFFSADEISKRFKVSNITSRRVLAELAGMNLIEKSRGRGCIVKKKHAIETIFIMAGDNRAEVSSLQSFVFSELYKGVIEESRLHNIKTKLISPPFFDTFPGDDRMDLIILQNVPTHLAELTERLTKDENINCVCCHALKPIEGITTVHSDRQKGAYDAVSYLIKKGHKRISFIVGGTPCWTAGRFDGYYHALKDNDVDFDTRLVRTIDLGKELVFKEMDELMKHEDPPSAIFAVSDAYALFILEYCQQNGIKVPEDLAVLGVNNVPESANTKPPLTTVETMLEEEGRESVRLLLECLPKDKIKDVVLKTKLIERESA